jgi:hypothetical protein
MMVADRVDTPTPKARMSLPVTPGMGTVGEAPSNVRKTIMGREANA